MTTVENTRSEPVQHSWPDLTCYGCGPANDEGLQLESYVGRDGETLVATVEPDELFNSGAPNVMYGGHIASLIDCHSIWTAVTVAYRDEDRPLGSLPPDHVRDRSDVGGVSGPHSPRPTRTPAKSDRGRYPTQEHCPDRTRSRSRVTGTGELLAVRVNLDDISGHHQADIQLAGSDRTMS